MVKVGIVGVGTVGEAVVKNILKNREIIKSRAGKEIKIVKGVVRDLNKKRDINIPLTTNYKEVTQNPEIDIVVELMGGVDKAYEVVKDALLHKKAVVTANKALLAYHRFELQKIAKTPFEYEASVAGGIPIIKALRDGLSANHILEIKGIINGTCNYILTEMKKGRDYNEVLKEAQNKGYAEADPTFDVGGFDAAHKLLILASIAYNIDAKPEDILIEGIENINLTDIEFAKEFGYEIKLLGIAKKISNEIELRVHPTLIKKNEMISKVDGVMNAVSVVGDIVGETMYYGPGAGGDATSSAVISDIIEIARGNKNPMLGYKIPLEIEKVSLKEIDEIESKYYLRIAVNDEVGVLEKIAHILAKNNISIESFLQKPRNGYVKLLFSTHKCKEKEIKKAINEIQKQNFVIKPINFIRIEE
ncbi:homoserine dehydrogenase [Caminibacter mediatlanticus TB-2]|uniref:Homoserine dehydrogenase n=1 Tax=Caminibacter mediatlanticus TB-2 TaxID=391592 RepID=A0ABX5V9G8_9BACT|nr:homoserine dehydrogenase [Caminibacter mediatlanticus]QCT94229.1 homoserine dehydrogenase [Caminibacter mediatlanticus TB-2]